MVKRFHPGAESVPFFSSGATDGRFFRRLGAVAYGFAMFSNRISFSQFLSMFHGDDERVDVESLAIVRRDVRGSPPLVFELSAAL